MIFCKDCKIVRTNAEALLDEKQTKRKNKEKQTKRESKTEYMNER